MIGIELIIFQKFCDLWHRFLTFCVTNFINYDNNIIPAITGK